jgi:uncharacterized protein (TIGR01370 family)
MRLRLPLFVVLFAFILAVIAYMTFRAAPLRWLVCYATTLTPQDFKNVDWAIVEQDANVKAWHNNHTQFFGYLSIGEADLSRLAIKDRLNKSFLLTANPNWPNAYQVDVRNAEWHAVLFDDMLPGIAARFDGVFLDTLDVPLELERSDPQHFAGSRDALIAIIREIHEHYPKLKIITNNALSILPAVGNDITAALVEDLYTSYDFTAKRVQPTAIEATQNKERALSDFHTRFKKPVLAVLYQDDNSQTLSQRAVMQAQAHGFDWYLAPIDLMSIGAVYSR